MIKDALKKIENLTDENIKLKSALDMAIFFIENIKNRKTGNIPHYRQAEICLDLIKEVKGGIDEKQFKRFKRLFI